MIRDQFDFRKAYHFIRYGRMSDLKQNPTSPDQQFDTIDRTLERCQYNHWQHLQDYRDDGITGKSIRKRAGFQKMLFDIKSGVISPDLILVDDIDRFGRMEELKELRRDLYNKYGVLILDAKSNFSDPHGPQGRVYSAVEEIRATEEGRTKAHRVIRGKRDAIQRKRWGGGPPPFGYMLETKTENRNGQPNNYSILVPNQETSWILDLAFCKADETGWGQERVTRFLNEHPDIPDKYKPFQASTVGSWFDNEIYIGVMVWPKVATDYISDCRVVEKTSEEERIRIEGYCEPIVQVEVFKRVSRVRKLRGDARRAALATSNQKPDKLLKAPAPGLTLKFLLTGLVRCGHCNRAMVPNGAGVYTTKDGDERRYVAYFCPGSGAGICSNKKRIPEEWLRKVVVDTIRNLLFPLS